MGRLVTPHDNVALYTISSTCHGAVKLAIAVWEPRRIHNGRVVAIKDRWRWLRRQGWTLRRVLVLHEGQESTRA